MNVCKRIRHPLALRPADRSVEEQELIEAHLASCPNCAARARAYAEQDRLIRSVPRVGLTPSQRGQLLSRIQRERRRHKMRINLSTVLSTAVGLVVLTVVGFGVRVLLSQSGQPSPGTPSVQYPTDEATPLTTTKLIFADEIGLEQVRELQRVKHPKLLLRSREYSQTIFRGRAIARFGFPKLASLLQST
jgi:predicted anti-sigma-YlaC factor YlaD